MKKKKVRVRRTWTIKPTTRISNDKTKYNRQKSKREIKHQAERNKRFSVGRTSNVVLSTHEDPRRIHHRLTCLDRSRFG
jgi:hypothetical protein